MFQTLIEVLEPRRLCADLSGVIWGDLDRSQTYDTTESPLRKWHAFIDSNANGRFDANELVATTDRSGRYTFTGLKNGDYLIGVVPPAGYGQTTPGPLGAVRSQFTINLTFSGAFTAETRAAFTAAAGRWESIVQGIDTNDGLRAASVTISAKIDDIDGIDGTLAQSNPTRFQNAHALPSAGSMEFDSADIAQLKKDDQLVSTITHEMGHVLGFGTVWTNFGLLVGEGTRSVRYIGTEGVQAYNTLFHKSATSVPVESGGGSGTADGHWRETDFQEELMTGFVEAPGVFQPLSRITVAQFADLGYQVNLNAADAWNPIAHTAAPTTALSLGGKAFERRATVSSGDDVGNVNFGYRADTAPVIQTFSVSPKSVSAGTNVVLAVSQIADAERDAVAGVSFWRESNQKRGLQTGKGGDTYIAAKNVPRRRRWAVETATDGLPTGQQVFYAVAIDDLGLAGKGSVALTIVSPPRSMRGAASALSIQSVSKVIYLVDDSTQSV